MRPHPAILGMLLTGTVANGCGDVPEITFKRFDPGAGCWYWTTEELDPLYWTEWATADSCTQGNPMFTADQSGQCVKFTESCTGVEVLPPDPWLAGCTDYPECCERAVREAPPCPVEE